MKSVVQSSSRRSASRHIDSRSLHPLCCLRSPRPASWVSKRGPSNVGESIRHAPLRQRATRYEVGSAEVESSNHPWKQWATFEIAHQEGNASPAVTRRLMGMGTWLTRGMFAPEYEFLVSEIEGLWRQILETAGFGLKRFDHRWKFVDSMDKDGRKGELYTRESPNPTVHDAEYPRLLLENRAYKSHVFQKLHLGVGIRQDGLQFVHCVMMPKPEYDIPIFGFAAVGMKRMSIAHVDLFPVSVDRSLSPLYAQGLKLLQMQSVTSNRLNPDWAGSIASSKMIHLTPKDKDHTAQLLSYTCLLAKLYMKTTEIMKPIVSQERIAQIEMAHEKFRERSRGHEQIRSCIAKSFGDDWTEMCNQTTGNTMKSTPSNTREQLMMAKKEM